jgi:hypothetical protein
MTEADTEGNEGRAPAADPGPAPRPPRSKALTIAAVACAAVFVVSAGAFVALRGSAAGDSSPTEAVARLFAAANDTDVVGAIDALAPSERDLVQGSVPDAVLQLQRVGLLRVAPIHPVEGLSITTESLRYRTTALSPTLVAVDVEAGRLTMKSDRDRVLLTDLAREILANDFSLDVQTGSATRDFAQHPLRLVTVNEGGQWYVSAAYSLAENLRAARPDDAPAYGRGPTPVGADTAEGAARGLVERYVAADATGVVVLLDPRERGVYADYLSLLTPLDPKVIAQRNQGKDPRTVPIEDRMGIVKTATLHKLELASEGSAPNVRVRITDLDVDIDDEVQHESIEYDGSCLTVAYRFGADGPVYKRSSSCAEPAPSTGSATTSDAKPTRGSEPEGEGKAERERERERERENEPTGKSEEEREREREQASGAPPPDNAFSALAMFGHGGELPALSVVQRDGRWYVSPVRSIVASTMATMRDLEPGRVDALVGRVHRLFDRTPSDLADEARDPDNAIFGPSAVANNRLVASCFVEIAITAGEEAAAEHTTDCVKELVDQGKVPPEAAAANLVRECYAVQPTAPPALDNTYRHLYLASRAASACFKRVAAESGLPAGALDELDKPLDQPCIEPYRALTPEAPEPVWAAADAQVQACFDALSAAPNQAR